MSSDSDECLRKALSCMHFAQAARSLETRDEYARLARKWFELAEELEKLLPQDAKEKAEPK